MWSWSLWWNKRSFEIFIHFKAIKNVLSSSHILRYTYILLYTLIYTHWGRHYNHFTDGKTLDLEGLEKLFKITLLVANMGLKSSSVGLFTTYLLECQWNSVLEALFAHISDFHGCWQSLIAGNEATGIRESWWCVDLLSWTKKCT